MLLTAKIKIQWLHYITSVPEHDRKKKRCFCELVICGNVTIDIKVCVCTDSVQDNIVQRNVLNMLMGFPLYCIPTLVSYCT